MIKKIIVCVIIFIAVALTGYVRVLPAVVQKHEVLNFAFDGMTVEIKWPKLTTHFTPKIDFGAAQILVAKDNEQLVNIENLDGSVSLARLIVNKITLKKLTADNIFVDAQKLAALAPQEQQPQKSGPELDFKNAEVALKISVNKSNVIVGTVGEKITLDSQNFSAADAVELLALLPGMQEPLSYFGGTRGDFDFNINLEGSDVDGKIDFNSLVLNIVPLNNLPVRAESGQVLISGDQILLKDFRGYYGKNRRNDITMGGHVENYMKAPVTEIVIRGTATDELTADYMSPLAGVKINLAGDSPTRLTVNSAGDQIDMEWVFYVPSGKDVLLEGYSFSPVNYDRALKADFHFEKDLFAIKSIDYYIARELKRGGQTKPIIRIAGNLDAARNFAIKDLGFTITKPLPSEFLNLFTRAKTFKGGTIAGNLQFIDDGVAAPDVLLAPARISGRLEMQNVRIPSARLSIKNGVMYTTKKGIHLDADGKFRRSGYTFNGNIANKMTLPVVVKDVDLNLDTIDIERVLKSLDRQNAAAAATTPPPQEDVEDDDESAIVFQPNLFVIEQCNFRLDKGKYKTIEFGNLDAALTLDKNGNLKIQSNKFDFAQGISTLRVICDLMKQKYYIRLGCKDVEIDLIATSLLSLEKEITGRASALLELNTDDKFKLNGLILFSVKDGSISKLGLVQYALNAAAIFRNPITMISPSTLLDLVNIPEGTFESIDGELRMKDNIINRMKIKSASPQLSSFIAGRYNLETRDTSLRIYTKFSSKNKGVEGFLRNLSLNRLAKTFDVGDKNNANYYAAEIAQLPEIEGEDESQIFLTKVEGDVERNNFISFLKKLK